MSIDAICKRLKEARLKHGFLSARTFALHHYIPDSTYTQHESGKRKMSIGTLLNYCLLLEINPTWLLMGQQELEPAKIGLENIETDTSSTLDNLMLPFKPITIDLKFLTNILMQISQNATNVKNNNSAILNICIKIYNLLIHQPDYANDPTMDSKINKIIINTLHTQHPAYSSS